MTNKFRVVSMFAGIGGMDLGVLGGFKFLDSRYKKLDTEVVLASDFDSKAMETYRDNFSHNYLVEDIRNISSKDLPKYDILTGGFPCQSFSVAATNPPRLGYEDERGQLFFELVRILRETKPQCFIAENVKGLLSANDRRAFPLVLAEFENAGYFVKWQVLNAADFGVPQKRQRVFLVGFKKRQAYEAFEFPKPLNAIVPLEAVLEDGPIDESFFFSKRAVQGMRNTKNSKIMNKGRAQDTSLPCNTVGAHLAKVSLNSTDPVLLDGGRYRMFTPREVARIQSFPDKFKLPGNRTTTYRGLGNAVAPVMMWHVTRSVIDALRH
jgi:DNA (cytosine-5)-methyltransferase 1